MTARAKSRTRVASSTQSTDVGRRDDLRRMACLMSLTVDGRCGSARPRSFRPIIDRLTSLFSCRSLEKGKTPPGFTGRGAQGAATDWQEQNAPPRGLGAGAAAKTCRALPPHAWKSPICYPQNRIALNAAGLQPRRPGCAGRALASAGRAALAEPALLPGAPRRAQESLAVPHDGVAHEPAVDRGV